MLNQPLAHAVEISKLMELSDDLVVVVPDKVELASKEDEHLDEVVEDSFRCRTVMGLLRRIFLK
jgi:hypothetical protein